jgi:hypothetical protein
MAEVSCGESMILLARIVSIRGDESFAATMILLR